MIKTKISTKIDMSGLKKLQKQLKNSSVNVGYINSKDHWMNEGVPVAQIASSLHDWSPWADTFMLSESKSGQVEDIIRDNINKINDISSFVRSVGDDAVSKIADNIESVQYPRNSDEWAAIKGNNDPLVFGSATGETPNLISELTFKIGSV